MTGEQIKELRESLKLSQEMFGQRIGVSFITIHRWEAGKSKPHKSFMKKMERIQKGQTHEAV